MAELMPTQAIYAKLVGQVGELHRRGQQGLAQDLLTAIREGRMPVTPEGQRILAETLRSAGYTGTPESFVSQYAASGNGGQTRGGVGEMVGQGDTAGVGGIAGRAVAAAAAAGAPGAATTPAETGRQEIGPGYGPSPSSTVAQSGPTGVNTLGTANQIQPTPVPDRASSSSFAAPGNTGSEFAASQGMALAGDDDRLIRFALQQAGLNPDRMTSFSRIVGRALVPLLRSARAAHGLTDNATQDQLPDFIKGLAGSLTAKGGNFFGQLQAIGNNAMGSENMQNYLSGISNPEDQAAFIQSLLPARFAGANPMIQQSVSDTSNRTLEAFKDQDFYSGGASVPASGVFIDWLNQQQNIDPVTRRIFGIR